MAQICIEEGAIPYCEGDWDEEWERLCSQSPRYQPVLEPEELPDFAAREAALVAVEELPDFQAREVYDGAAQKHYEAIAKAERLARIRASMEEKTKKVSPVAPPEPISRLAHPRGRVSHIKPHQGRMARPFRRR